MGLRLSDGAGWRAALGIVAEPAGSNDFHGKRLPPSDSPRAPGPRVGHRRPGGRRSAVGDPSDLTMQFVRGGGRIQVGDTIATSGTAATAADKVYACAARVVSSAVRVAFDAMAVGVVPGSPEVGRNPMDHVLVDVVAYWDDHGLPPP